MKERLNIETYEAAIEFQCIGSRAVKKAQAENRKKGIPNAYSLNGRIIYELPNGEITTEDPFEKLEEKS